MDDVVSPITLEWKGARKVETEVDFKGDEKGKDQVR